MIPGIGGVEYLVIATLIIIFVAPKDLPMILKTLGTWWVKIRNISRDFRSSINSIANESGINDIKNDIENVSSKNFTDEMRDSINKSIVDDEQNKNKKN
jgi:sec-independent protein translocase protein TatB|tara:strand:+ start:269 stop:565 length:297 start_codon:yes stop_codon:yes gene_type:complete